jgi:hypothetical protein
MSGRYSFWGEKREPIPMNERHSKREDNEYIRRVYVEPLDGRRYISASSRRTGKNWAREVKSIVTDQYLRTDKVVLVMDNANPRFENTHTLFSLYETFPAGETFRIAQKLELPYTSKHGGILTLMKMWNLPAKEPAPNTKPRKG